MTTVERQRILVVTDDVVGDRMAGPGIRAWNIAGTLAEQHDVRLASTRPTTAIHPRFAVCDGSGGRLRALAEGMDVIVLQGFTLRFNPWLAEVGAHLVMDMYDPIHLEILEGAGDATPEDQVRQLAGALRALRVQFEEGDFFLCATERQRDLWLGHLAASGRINPSTYRQDPTLRSLIDLAPFGTQSGPAMPPGATGAVKGVMDGIGVDDRLILWAGGVYNWFDPVTLVEAVADLVPDVPNVRLLFMGTKHPALDDLSTTVLRSAIDRARDLGLLGSHVFFREGWVPYDERGRYLADADLGVSTHTVHVETAFSFRTRMLDYLWAGLPIVCTEGDEFAGIVRREGLGRVVGEGDRADLARALRELLTDPTELDRCRAAVRDTEERFRWERTLAPLVRYCADPWPAADRAPASRPVGRVSMVGTEVRERVAHAGEYVRVNGLGRFLRIGLRRTAGAITRPVLRRLRPAADDDARR